MRRKMVWFGIPWLLGLFVAASFPESTTMYLLLAAFLLLGAFRLFRQISIKQALFAAVSATLAVVFLFGYTRLVYQPIARLDQRFTTFSGEVVSMTVYDDEMASYQVKGSFHCGPSATILIYTDDLGADYGDELKICGGFSKIRSNYLWDGAAYYRAKGIFLEAENDAYVSCTHTETQKLMRTLQAYRSHIATKICVYAGMDAGGMVSAMLLGTRDLLADETNEMLTRHGVSHVISVSGLHLVVILFLLGFVCRKLHIHCWVEFVLSVAVIFCYAMMVCMPVSMVRAGIMYLLMTSGRLFFRRADTLNSLCIAGVLITLPNPYCILDASFLLSLVGTFGIGVFAPFMMRRFSHVRYPFRILVQLGTMICVSVCTYPVLLLYFREISIVSPLSNVLLVPICSAMLVLSLAIFLTGGAAYVAAPIGFLLRILYDLMYAISDWIHAILPYTFPTGWDLLPLLSFILLVLVVYAFVAWRKPRAVALSIVFSIVILYLGQVAWRSTERDNLIITVLGNKNESVVVVQHQDMNDSIDITGHHRNPDYIKAYAAEQGIAHFNAIALMKNGLAGYVSYKETLRWLGIYEFILPEDCAYTFNKMPEGCQAVYASEWKINHTLYTIERKGEQVFIQYGTYRFLITDYLREIPEEPVHTIICNHIRVDESPYEVSIYQKAKMPIQIRVSPDGTYEIREIGDEKE